MTRTTVPTLPKSQPSKPSRCLPTTIYPKKLKDRLSTKTNSSASRNRKNSTNKLLSNWTRTNSSITSAPTEWTANSPTGSKNNIKD